MKWGTDYSFHQLLISNYKYSICLARMKCKALLQDWYESMASLTLYSVLLKIFKNFVYTCGCVNARTRSILMWCKPESHISIWIIGWMLLSWKHPIWWLSHILQMSSQRLPIKRIIFWYLDKMEINWDALLNVMYLYGASNLLVYNNRLKGFMF